jgi:deoxyribonuclease V
MRTQQLHPWDLTPRQAAAVQEQLRGRILERPLAWRKLRSVAGCDVAVAGETLVAAVVVLDAGSLEVLDTSVARDPARFPYVPGLLSFREVPVLLRAFERLPRRPDVVLCDGQGRAHPRRFGLACHLGLLLDLPSVGVAKSRLTGVAEEPGQKRGSWKPILDEGEEIGRLLRTRDRVRPLYVSVGHKITLDDAAALVLKTGAGLRLPEPTRLADKHVGLLARSGDQQAPRARRRARLRPMR